MRKMETKSSKGTKTKSKETVTKAKNTTKISISAIAKKTFSKQVSVPKFRKVSVSLAKSHTEISKDTGQLLGKVELQAAVNDICQMMKSLKKKDVKDPDQLLENMKNLAITYTRQINFRDGTVGGTITKYRIQQGMLFLSIKKAVRFAGKKWKDWFNENFSKREFRSVQEFMQLAKKPSSINYAVLGTLLTFFTLYSNPV